MAASLHVPGFIVKVSPGRAATRAAVISAELETRYSVENTVPAATKSTASSQDA